jgi:succinoglycan biosynthesis transport protein ExoP
MSDAPYSLRNHRPADPSSGGGGYATASLSNGEEAGLAIRLRRQKATFLLVFAGVLGIAGLVFLITPNSYLATGAVIVTSRSAQIAGNDVSPAAEQKLGDPADMDSQIIVAKSPRLLARMTNIPGVLQAVQQDCEAVRWDAPVNRLRAVIGWPARPCDMQRPNGKAVDWLQERFRVAGIGRSRVIQIAYQSQSPEAAAVLVNGLVDTYLAQGTTDEHRSLDEAATWVRTELDRIAIELRDSERTIESFRRDHGLVRGQTASIASERLTQVSQQLAAAEAAASNAAAKLDQLRNGAGDAHQTLDSRTIADLKQKLAEVQGTIANMTSGYGSSYPKLVALKTQRSDLERQIVQETSRIKSSIEGDYAIASAQVSALRQQLADVKKDVGVGGLAETQIASMVRDNEVKRELYIDLSKKANDLEAQRRLLTGDVQLVNHASPPTKAASPTPLLFGMAGLMAASILAVAAALLRDRADQTVRSTARVWNATDVSVLGHIPFMRQPVGGTARSVGLLGSPSALQEAIRSLYARCITLGGPVRPCTLLIASAGACEGKSFLTLALAQFGAASGRRVLAVEADMRKPGWRSSLDLRDAGPGLVDVLQGVGDYGEALRSTALGFDVLLAGVPTIASTELLSNGRITPFLEWARQHYDLVLIDSPPSQWLMDAQLLAGKVDAVLFCARWGHSSLEAVAQGVRDMRQAGGRVIGVALSMVKLGEYPLYGATKLPRSLYLAAPG